MYNVPVTLQPSFCVTHLAEVDLINKTTAIGQVWSLSQAYAYVLYCTYTHTQDGDMPQALTKHARVLLSLSVKTQRGCKTQPIEGE